MNFHRVNLLSDEDYDHLNRKLVSLRFINPLNYRNLQLRRCVQLSLEVKSSFQGYLRPLKQQWGHHFPSNIQWGWFEIIWVLGNWNVLSKVWGRASINKYPTRKSESLGSKNERTLDSNWCFLIQWLCQSSSPELAPWNSPKIPGESRDRCLKKATILFTTVI